MAFTSRYYQVVELVEVDSTSRYLKTELSNGHLSGPLFCFAHRQTAGYGQRGREWTQSRGSLTFSMALPFDGDIGTVPFISAQIALLIRQSMAETSSKTMLTVKWPNDVFLNAKKVAGCLIEMVSSPGSKPGNYLVIGVGVNLSPVAGDGFESEFVADLDQNGFLQRLSERLYHLFVSDERPVFNSIDWQKHDFFMPGQEVIVYHNESSKKGRYVGLDEMAQAIVDIEGRMEYYHSGAVSIRPL